MNRAPPPKTKGLAAACLAAFAVTLALYGATTFRGLDYADNGELAAVAWTLGIAHPTGYPTFTLLGHLVAHALPFRPILTLNLFSALLGAASAGAMAWAFGILLELATPRRESSGSSMRAFSAAAAAVAIAGSGLWWDQAQRWEVYSLHALTLALAAGFFLRFAEEGRGGAAFALSLGVAFTAHMTTVLLAPACLGLWIARRGLSRERLRELPPLLPWLALGLSPYLYLPLRSAQGPRFDWDAPHTWDGFTRMLCARDYGGWLFSDPGTFVPQWRFFFGRLPAEVGWLGLPLAVIGWFALIQRAPRLAAFALLLFAASVFFAGGYGIPDIGSYFQVAMLGIGIALAAGLDWAARRFGTVWGVATGAALVALVLATQLPRQIAPPGSAVEDMARDVLEPLPPRAVVLTNQWDAWMSGSFYLQEVEGLRRDVTVIDGEALNRPWYLGELMRRAPDLCAPIRPEIDRMTAVARTSAESEPAFESAYRDLWHALVDRALEHRRVFVTRDETPRVDRTLSTTPAGLAFEVSRAPLAIAAEPPRWRFDPKRARRDPYGAMTCELYARAALDRAYVEAGRGQGDRARRDLTLAQSFDPGWRAADLPPQPWGATATMGRSLAFFDVLHGFDLAALERGARAAGLSSASPP
jgi:hypothetical protein